MLVAQSYTTNILLVCKFIPPIKVVNLGMVYCCFTNIKFVCWWGWIPRLNHVYICAMVKRLIASVALAFTRRGCYGWWGACLTDRAMTCVRWYVCSFCGKPWRFCDTLPPLLAYCLHLVPYNSVTRVRCQLEMPLPIVIFNFLICRWLLSRFLVMSELTPLSNVLLSNWVSGAQSQPDLRFWYSMDPAVSRA
jgi:hypothetical protein